MPTGNDHAMKLNNFFTGLGLDSELFDDDEDVDKIVRNADYGKQSDPYFCFGVSFVNSGPDYKYKVRFNITTSRGNTEGPYTNSSLTSFRAFDGTLY